ncbi:uncharacterized protein LOC131207035 [Anopheles bellator]|uniref:uncharacterized protein LOC131207035 n=1 Tax=Anopheles bellator TaxID=139047 RepID=UPI0026478EE0|nr:uncharacterized protein LOC131207035 [Anopheles bellator]
MWHPRACFFVLAVQILAMSVHCTGGTDRQAVVRARQKRTIIFPGNPSLGLLFAIAVPLGVPDRNIFVSYNFEQNYNTPTQANDFTEGFGNFIHGIVEELTSPTLIVPGPSINVTPREMKKTGPQITRRRLFRIIREHLQNQNFNGKACLQRIICEASLHQFAESNGVIGDLVQIMLSPSMSKSEKLPDDYVAPERVGKSGSCDRYRSDCPKDPLQMIMGPSQATDATVDSVGEGRILVAGKPILVYPQASPTRHQLIFGIGVPVQDNPHSIVVGWVIKAWYYQPNSTADYAAVYVEGWNDSRRSLPEDRNRRSIERYEVDNVPTRLEPLPSDGVWDELDDEPEEEVEDEVGEDPNGGTSPDSDPAPDAQEPTAKPEDHSGATFNVHSSRWLVYKALERMSFGYGFGGRACILRSICDAAEAQFTHTGGVFGELLHIMFSPSSTEEPLSEHRDNEYLRAEQLGRTGAPCDKIFHECSTSMLDLFSGVHDPARYAFDPTAFFDQLHPSMVRFGMVLVAAAAGVLLLLPITIRADFIPWLIVPETSPTRHQLISGIGIPVGTPESITSGWVIKAQYYLPTKVDDLKPTLWEGWNDSRRELSKRAPEVPVTRLPRSVHYERYEAGKIVINEQPLDDPSEIEQGDQFDDGDENYWIDQEEDEQLRGQVAGATPNVDPAHRGSYNPQRSRWSSYKALEGLSEKYGLAGRPCVLRSVCEAATAQFTHTGGIFAELLHIMFTPSSTREPVSEHRDNEYFRAEQLGRSGAPCERLFPECVHSLLDVFTGVHDPETDTLRVLHDQVKAYLMRK